MDLDITCPHCGRIDLIQSVPALHADGVSTSYGTSQYSGLGVASTGLVPVVGTATVEHTHTTALARSLAREPSQLPSGRLTVAGLLLLLPALILLAPAIAAIVTTDPQVRTVGTWIGALFMVVAVAIPGLIVMGAVIRRDLRNARIRRGRPHAHAVWQAGFYCHRCGVAYWPYSPAPGIPARQPFAPPQFRWFVWNAGGYNNA
ncbi:hypothetical protein ACFYT3_20385 [Nocardia amikacinitolerans]|uniref:hypothetical protein n=1 Tax=Nocardia amikacinitolerans TaxID=756689 RepID=UPI0036927F0E